MGWLNNDFHSPDVMQFYAALSQAVQHHNESISEFIHRVEYLASKAYAGTADQQLIEQRMVYHVSRGCTAAYNSLLATLPPKYYLWWVEGEVITIRADESSPAAEDAVPAGCAPDGRRDRGLPEPLPPR